MSGEAFQGSDGCWYRVLINPETGANEPLPVPMPGYIQRRVHVGGIDKDGQPVLSRDGGCYWLDCSTVEYVAAVHALNGLTALAEWVAS